MADMRFGIQRWLLALILGFGGEWDHCGDAAEGRSPDMGFDQTCGMGGGKRQPWMLIQHLPARCDLAVSPCGNGDGRRRGTTEHGKD